MPTYQNDSTEILWIKNSFGSRVPIDPGDTIETVYYGNYEDIGFTITSDLPIYQEVIQEDIITGLSAVSQTVSINDDTKNVLIHKITDLVTVRRNDDSAIPILRDQTNEDVTFLIEVDERTIQLKLTGNEGCRVIQFSK